MLTRNLITVEYVCKGVFLGLAFSGVVFAAGLSSAVLPFASAVGLAAACLVVTSLRRLSGGGKGSQRRWLAMLVLALLDQPFTVYGSMMAGFLIGGLISGWNILFVVTTAIAGAVFGGLIRSSMFLSKRSWRLLASLAVVVLFAAGIGWLIQSETLSLPESGWSRSLSLAASAALFYILTFAGRGEETELEIGMLSLMLALALAQLELPVMFRGAVVILPMALFVVYCERMRKHLIVFKHVLRGMSHEQEANLRDALLCYRRALKTDPKAELAVAGNWRVHKKINLADLSEDEEVLELIDPLVCLQRARQLLGRPSASPEEVQEADKLLDIVEHRRKDVPQSLGLERLRILLAQADRERAFDLLSNLIDRTSETVCLLPDHELEALYRTWALALKDPLLVGGGALDLLEQPDRLFSLLCVLERRLTQLPDDEEAKSFKPFLYDKVTHDLYRDYAERNADDTMEWFDYHYCWQKGLALMQQGDQGESACDWLFIAEHGLADHRLVIWRTLAQIYERTDSQEARRWNLRIKQFARELGVSKLSKAQRDAYFETVRLLAQQAEAAGDVDAAIENYQLYSESSKSGIGTLETLERLYQSKDDPLMALRPVEAALTYNLGEKQRQHWLKKKAALYGKLTADEVQPRLAGVERIFDFAYCYRTAEKIFQADGSTDEVIRYLDLASLGGTAHLLKVNYLLGRAHLRTGRIEDAVACLEQVVQNRPKSFVDDDQKQAYFSACRLLGDLYLDDLEQPGKAVECYTIYKDFLNSGAETLFRLGKAYEANGQPAHARKWYDMVLVYPSHPRADDAKKAMARLGSG